MKIRNATNNDYNFIYKLAKKLATSFEINENKFKNIYPKIIADKNISLIVAEINDQIVGYCLAFHHLTFYATGNVTWIEEIIVDENFRQKGIGSKLMQEIEKSAKLMNSKLIALATRRSSGFYKKSNYEESATYFRKLL
jgi:N-acetylglutamate synthase-like GNAT family acetyltransferase